MTNMSKTDFPTPENPGDEESHALIQEQIRQDLRSQQEVEKLNSQGNEKSRHRLL